jgi:MtN3 and saliva related transmembrane protein
MKAGVSFASIYTMILSFIVADYIGAIAGICTATSLLPQLFKLIKEKKSEDISLSMLFTLLGGLALWITYGALKKDWPILLTNSFSVIVNSIIIALSIYYKRNKR